MKALTIITLSFCLFSNHQADITGTWQGKIADSQTGNNFDSVTIYLKLILSTDNKISGTSNCYYANNYYKVSSISGKFYKKQDGFYVVEDKVTETNFPNKAFVHIDRYDLTFVKEDTSRLNGEATCIRSTFRCHENILFSLKKIELNTENIKDSTNKDR